MSLNRPNVHPIIAELRLRRLGADLTQSRIAAELGYSTSDISILERHARNIPFQRIVDYAEFFGLELTLSEKSK